MKQVDLPRYWFYESRDRTTIKPLHVQTRVSECYCADVRLHSNKEYQMPTIAQSVITLFDTVLMKPAEYKLTDLIAYDIVKKTARPEKRTVQILTADNVRSIVKGLNVQVGRYLPWERYKVQGLSATKTVLVRPRMYELQDGVDNNISLWVYERATFGPPVIKVARPTMNYDRYSNYLVSVTDGQYECFYDGMARYLWDESGSLEVDYSVWENKYRVGGDSRTMKDLKVGIYTTSALQYLIETKSDIAEHLYKQVKVMRNRKIRGQISRLYWVNA